jgi:hypothetical protein
LAYAELTRATKKLFLFLSPENKFWSFIVSGDITQESIAEIVAIAPTTFSHWKHSWTVGADSLRKIFASLDTLLQTGELQINNKRKYSITGDNKVQALGWYNNFKTAYENASVDVYTTGKLLKLKVVECQQILDSLIYHKSPLFTGIYYDSDATATEYINKYSGIYLMLVKRGQRFLQCPMRIRYKLTINGLPTIRCKLNAPILRRQGDEPYWEYDGFFTGTDNRNYWIFEKRKKAERYDHFYFITGRGFDYTQGDDPNGKLVYLTMRGMYLSAHQNARQDIVSDVVFLQRQDNRTEEEEVELMHSAAQVLSTEKSTAVQQHYDAFVEYVDEELMSINS